MCFVQIQNDCVPLTDDKSKRSQYLEASAIGNNTQTRCSRPNLTSMIFKSEVVVSETTGRKLRPLLWGTRKCYFTHCKFTLFSRAMFLWVLAGHFTLVNSGAVGVSIGETSNLRLDQTLSEPSNTRLPSQKVFIHEEDLTQPTILTSRGEFNTLSLMDEENCTQPSIKDFPELFSMRELQDGAVLFHVIVSAYIFYAIAYLCETFFVPSVESVCKVLRVPPDVAGATFMAIATSSPEFFTNVIGTFVTNGDIGVGSVVGSVVFNLLVIVAWCGLATKDALKLEWWPLTRDCGFYVFSVLLLIGALWDGRIYWYEAVVFVLTYLGYIIVICKNQKIQTYITKRFQKEDKTGPTKGRSCELLICSLSQDNIIKAREFDESSPLLLGDQNGRYIVKPVQSTNSKPLDSRLNMSCTLKKNSNSYNNLQRSLPQIILISSKDKDSIKNYSTHYLSKAEAPICKETTTVKKEETDLYNIHNPVHEQLDFFELPRGKSWLKWFEWIMGWPVRLILHVTIPDCRMLRYQSWYPITFVICIVYMAIFSYLITWMMTVIGQILLIPDAVMGLTFIAAGTSLPEAISSIIVARQGLGTMSISNSVGSNTFNVLCCLGLPWLIKNEILVASSGSGSFIPMAAGGFGFVSIFLIASAAIIYGLIAWNKFYLDFKIGIVALVMYVLFVVLASLLELNYFFFVNLPTCNIDWN